MAKDETMKKYEQQFHRLLYKLTIAKQIAAGYTMNELKGIKHLYFLQCTSYAYEIFKLKTTKFSN